MTCPRCQQDNPPHARFCLGCGARLALTCGSCGAELPGGARFCLQCGQAVTAGTAAPVGSPAPETYTPKHLAEKILTSKAALEGERKQVTVLRVVFHMAAPCPPWLKQAWIDWLGGERILELYGGTEAQSFTVISGDEWLEHRGSVGRPVVGEILVLDAKGHELPPGDIGEIWMRRGPDVPPSYRYVGAEAKSRPGSWESLGDVGWKDADGYLYLSDRDTDMILVGGANVYPAGVESALDEHPKVTSSCVIGLPDDDYGNIVHAIVQTAERITATQLDDFLRSRLGTYKRPRTYEFVNEPLRGDDGKVRRSALRAERVAARGR